MKTTKILFIALLSIVLFSCGNDDDNNNNNASNGAQCGDDNYSSMTFELNGDVLPYILAPYDHTDPTMIASQVYIGLPYVHEDSLDNEPSFGFVFQSFNQALEERTYVVNDSFQAIFDLFYIAEPGGELTINDLSVRVDDLGLEYVTHVSGSFQGTLVAFNTDTAQVNVDFCMSWD